ncbi:MAG: hypothetical protein H0X37_06025 [Herpetosiphonaceae bacterium]|nr:hypothetical protein [Herpetosiphonaceae bacterium]
MPQLRVFQHFEFPDELKWQVVSFMRIEWPFIFTGANRFLTELCPPELHPVHFAIVEGNVLLSYGATLRLEQPHAGEVYRLYGLGNVFTFPPYRREGFGRQVVDAATHYILASAADVGALFCGARLAPYYRVSGWEAMEGATTRIGTPDGYETHNVLRMMLFVSEKGKRGRQAFMHTPFYIESPW